MQRFYERKKGFALPTVLLASVVLLMVLVAAVSATYALDNSVNNQKYSRLADAAAQAGTAFAQACLNNSKNDITWSDSKPLRPNTDCNGNVVSGTSAYLQRTSDYRTYFSVSKPISTYQDKAISTASKGYVELLREDSDVAWRLFTSSDAHAEAMSFSTVPPGTIISYAGASLPSGYLWADGSAVSRTTYADLFAAIGTTYGAGNGSTTFNLPDTRGNVLVNKSTLAAFNTLGKTGGEATHKLTTNEIPAHTHGEQFYMDGYGLRAIGGAETGSGGSPKMLESAGSSSAAATTTSTGGGLAHNNLQPYITVNMAIKF